MIKQKSGHATLQQLYLCGLCERVLRAFGDGAKKSAKKKSDNDHRRDDHQHEARQTGRDVKLKKGRGNKTAFSGK